MWVPVGIFGQLEVTKVYWVGVNDQIWILKIYTLAPVLKGVRVKKSPKQLECYQSREIIEFGVDSKNRNKRVEGTNYL